MASVVGRIFSVCAKNRALFRHHVMVKQTVPACSLKHYTRSRKVLKSLYNRRQEQGPEPDRHRSAWLNWNYDAEMFAFGKRLNESFNEETLRTAFVDKSYIQKEIARRAELEIEEEVPALEIKHNEELAAFGEDVAKTYIKGYLRHSVPLLPEEGICALCDYLTTDEMLAYIGSNLGIKDLIYCEELPPSVSTLSRTFKAVIGSLATDEGEDRAQLFVQDFILTELVGKDLQEIWDLSNPMGLLQGMLESQGRGGADPRLLWETGSQTVEAAYVVGIYSDKQLLGQAPGETVTIAEEMAARDALRRILDSTIDNMPFKFGKEGHQLSIDTQTVNRSILDYTKQQQIQS